MLALFAIANYNTAHRNEMVRFTHNKKGDYYEKRKLQILLSSHFL